MRTTPGSPHPHAGVPVGPPRRTRRAVVRLSMIAVTLFAMPPGIRTVRAEEKARPAAPAPAVGSAGADHWAFRAPIRPDPPVTKHAGAARTAIDRFVWARLHAERLAPPPPRT